MIVCRRITTLPAGFLNNVMQTKFCEGYYFGESAEQKRGLFEALGVSVPGPETEKEQDYEDEEETEF